MCTTDPIPIQDTSVDGAASTVRQVFDDPTRVSKCQRYQIVKYVLARARNSHDRMVLIGLPVFGSPCEDHYETGLLRSAICPASLRTIH